MLFFQCIHPVTEANILESGSLPNVPVLESAPLPDIPVVEARALPAVPTVMTAALADTPETHSTDITEVIVLLKTPFRTFTLSHFPSVQSH